MKCFDAGMERNFKKKSRRSAPSDAWYVSETHNHPVETGVHQHRFALEFVFRVRIDCLHRVPDAPRRRQVRGPTENVKARCIDDARRLIQRSGSFDQSGCSVDANVFGEPRIGITSRRNDAGKVDDDVLILDRSSDRLEIPHVTPMRVDGAPSFRNDCAAAHAGKIKDADAMATP